MDTSSTLGGILIMKNDPTLTISEVTYTLTTHTTPVYITDFGLQESMASADIKKDIYPGKNYKTYHAYEAKINNTNMNQDISIMQYETKILFKFP